MHSDASWYQFHRALDNKVYQYHIEWTDSAEGRESIVQSKFRMGC